jgi:hypothetical protein
MLTSSSVQVKHATHTKKVSVTATESAEAATLKDSAWTRRNGTGSTEEEEEKKGRGTAAAAEVGRVEEGELIVKILAVKEQRRRTRYALVAQVSPKRQYRDVGVL